MGAGTALWPLLALFLGTALGKGLYSGKEGRVLVDNKCQCVKVTTRFVPSESNPSEENLVRTIRIIVPLNNRENISDPNSPQRRRFVYKMSDLCKKCDPEEIELNGELFTASQSNCQGRKDVCYTYDRNKCYTSDIQYRYGGETKTIEVPLTQESCYK